MRPLSPSPPVGAPVGFPGVELVVDLHLLTADGEEALRLQWSDGRPSWMRCTGRSEDGTDLVVRGPRGVVVPYLCGLIESDQFLAAVSVSGNVAALSTLHGLSHHPDVCSYWGSRIGAVRSFCEHPDHQ